MSRSIDGELPLSWFTPPGTISVSQAALELARQFLFEARAVKPDSDWVVTFDWSSSRRVRTRGTNLWQDLGPGIDIVVYERAKVPASALEAKSGFLLALKIPSEVWLKSRKRLIDRLSGAPAKLVLL